MFISDASRPQQYLWKVVSRTIDVWKSLKNLVNFRNWAAGMHDYIFSSFIGFFYAGAI